MFTVLRYCDQPRLPKEKEITQQHKVDDLEETKTMPKNAKVTTNSCKPRENDINNDEATGTNNGEPKKKNSQQNNKVAKKKAEDQSEEDGGKLIS